MDQETNVGTVGAALVKGALKALEEKPKFVRKNGGGALLSGPTTTPVPDAAMLDVANLVDDKSIEEAKTRAAKRREFSVAALDSLSKLEDALNSIVEIEGWENDPELKGRAVEIEKKITGIKAAGGGHLDYAALVAEIEAVETIQEARAILARLETESFTERNDTRYSAPGREWVQRWKSAHGGQMPEGSVFFEEKWHVPFQPDSGHPKTGGQKRLEWLVTQMIRRIDKIRKAEGRRKASVFRTRVDILDFPADKVKNREVFIPGLYRLEIPAFKNGEKTVRPEGLMVLKAKTIKGKEGEKYTAVEFFDGTGCADRLVGKTYPVFDRNGRPIQVGLSLSFGQIMSRDMKIPQVFASSEAGKKDLLYFAQIVRAGIVVMYRKTEADKAEVEGTTNPEGESGEG